MAAHILWRKADPLGVEPKQEHDGDAGHDLRAAQSGVLPAKSRGLIDTGIQLAIPKGYCGLVLPRSGLAWREGITVLNAPGLIDSGYRGNVKVCLQNHSNSEHEIHAGDKIAQLVIVPLAATQFSQVGNLPASERGEGGFGSTGR